jgi:thioredoxin 1
MAMNDSFGRKRISLALEIFFLLLLAVLGQAQPGPQVQTDINTSASQLIFPGGPVDLDDRSLDGALKIYSPLVLDCWEVGCRPCQKIDPIINQMAKDFRGKIVFGKLCTDVNPITLAKYGVSRTPTLLIFENGTMVYKHVGYYPREELEHIILTVLQLR